MGILKNGALTIVWIARWRDSRIGRRIYTVIQKLGYCLPFADKVLELEHFVLQRGYLFGDRNKVAITAKQISSRPDSRRADLLLEYVPFEL